MRWQLIHNACWAGDAAEVERLIEAGADANQGAPTPWRQTPLGRTLEFRINHKKHAGHVEVDYRVTARRVQMARQPNGQLWAVTDTGMILRLDRDIKSAK